jgi:putative ABC transport system permease protein
VSEKHGYSDVFRARAGVRAVAAAERRTGLRTLLLFGALFGLVAGLVLGTAALGARTADAYPRLTDAVDLDDVRVQVPADQPGLVAAVPTLPDVRTAWMTYGWVARVEGAALRFISLGAGLDQPPDLIHPVLVAGRAPAPDAADEIMISEPLAEASDLRIGTAVTIRILTVDQIARFGSGVGDPKGPILRLWVVGIARMPAWGGPLSEARASPAFAQRYRGTAASRPAFIRLDDTPEAADRFAQAYAAAAAAAPPSELAAFLPPRVYRPRADGDPAARAAERTLVVGLTIFAAVLAAGGLLVVGQGLLRHHAAHRASQAVERALGLTAGERVAARLTAAGPAAVLAGVLAGALGMAAGTLQPLGSQARFEPEPGFRAPWGVVVGGALATALAFLALVAVAAAVAGRSARPAVRPARPHESAWTGLGPAALVGLRLAVRGHGRAVAVSAGAAVAVAGIVAALAFGSGIALLLSDPVRTGQAADFALEDAEEVDVAKLVVDPRVAAVAVTRSVVARLADGGVLLVQAETQRLGELPAGLVSGRLPEGPTEIALSPRVAAARGLNVGDTLTVVNRNGRPLPLTVTGTVAVVDDGGHLGTSNVVTDAALGGLARTSPIVRAEILAAPGQAGPLAAELGRNLEILPREIPPEVRNLADLARLPEILAAALAVVAGAAMAHTLITAARHHTREMAVLAAIGATPGQIRATLAVLGGAIVAPALVLGVPVGLATARLLWWQVATSIGVGGDLTPPVGLLTGTVSGVFVLALLLALAPGLRATRASTAMRQDG